MVYLLLIFVFFSLNCYLLLYLNWSPTRFDVLGKSARHLLGPRIMIINWRVYVVICIFICIVVICIVINSPSLQELLAPLMVSYVADDGELIEDKMTVIVHRANIMKSAMYAVKSRNFHFRRHIDVQFVGEEAQDDGGPRREFFR